MTSKSEAASGEVVKARKNLAPDTKLEAQVNVSDSLPTNEELLEVAVQADIDATRARAIINSGQSNSGQRSNGQRNNLLRSGGLQKTTLGNSAAIDSPGALVEPGVRNLRSATQAKLDQELLAKQNKKSQAQLAREKLAAAAAKKLHIQSQVKARAKAKALKAKQQSTSKLAAANQPKKQSNPASSSNARTQGTQTRTQQNKTEAVVEPGNQLIQLFPTQKAKSQEAEKPQSKKPPIINATALLAAKYPNYFADNNDHRTKTESRTVFVVSSMILGLIGFGWINWNTINFQSGGDFTYNSGLIGGIAMLVVLLYAVRKRAKIMRKAGNMEGWYYFHLFGGVLGPLIIVFHTGFVLKSINSAVALVTMVIIVLSGVFGRYIYTRIGYRLHRKLLAIKESETQLMETLHSYESPRGEKIERRLSNFALSALTGDRSLVKLPMRVVAIRAAAAACYVKVSVDLSAMIKVCAKRDGWPITETKGRISREKEQLRDHISAIANIAHSHLFERVLVRWRILHIPLLYILVITALFHVLAVHLY